VFITTGTSYRTKDHLLLSEKSGPPMRGAANAPYQLALAMLSHRVPSPAYGKGKRKKPSLLRGLFGLAGCCIGSPYTKQDPSAA
jgi:hypothetical protein